MGKTVGRKIRPCTCHLGSKVYGHVCGSATKTHMSLWGSIVHRGQGGVAIFSKQEFLSDNGKSKAYLALLKIWGEAMGTDGSGGI